MWYSSLDERFPYDCTVASHSQYSEGLGKYNSLVVMDAGTKLTRLDSSTDSQICVVTQINSSYLQLFGPRLEPSWLLSAVFTTFIDSVWSLNIRERKLRNNVNFSNMVCCSTSSEELWNSCLTIGSREVSLVLCMFVSITKPASSVYWQKYW